MKKTKKIAAVLLAGVTTAALAAGLTACGDSGSAEEDTRDKDIVAVYNLYAASAGSDALTYEDWLQSITGAQGEKGDTGAAGKSAYDIWLEAGNEGSEADFLESLKGVGVEGVYETSEGTFVKYTDGTYQAIETGGAEYELLIVGDNYIDIPANTPPPSLEDPTDNGITFNFYVLEDGEYTFTIYDYDTYVSYSVWYRYSDTEIRETGGMLDPDANTYTTTRSIVGGTINSFKIYNYAETDATYRLTITKNDSSTTTD